MTAAATITRRETVLLVAVGVAVRILFLMLARSWTEPVHLGEATNASLAFARRGTIADAYFPGQGPTAHLLPTMVVIAGAIERALGPESPAANVALALWALLQVAGGFVLTVALCRRLGASRGVLLAGLALLCLCPGLIAQEAGDFRVWENALGYDLAAASLLWMVTLDRRVPVRERELAVAALCAALAFFVSPPAGLGVCACWGLFALRRLTIAQAARFALLGALAMTAVIGPWALRNRAQLGETVLLRSNFGLELAIANHAGAVDPADPRAAYSDRLAQVHQSRERFAAAGGEIAWSRKVGAEARRWIAANPAAFARLSVRHYRQFYVPDTWEEALSNWDGANRVRIVMLQVIGAMGLLGLVAGLRRGGGHRLLAVYVLVSGLPYALVQPMPRYAYIVYPLLVFFAVQLAADLVAVCARKAATRPPGAE